MKLAILAIALTACTTLGPMPSTTGISAIPQGRTGVELQGGGIPGFHLSTGVEKNTRGDSLKQLSGLVDLQALLPGLLVGARAFGDSGDSMVEPYVGYRTKVSDEVSVGGVAFGTANRSGDNGASYYASRAGAELMADAQLIEFTDLIKLHGQVAATATRIAARGTYCTDGSFGVDCNGDDNDKYVTVHTSGIYSTGTAQLTLDFGRRPHGEIHDVQLSFLISLGSMPKVEAGKQIDSAGYASAGLLLSVGLGAD